MKRDHFRVMAVGVAFLVSAAFLARIPVSVPPLWALPPWAVRGLLAFLLPTVATGICLVARRLASLDPRRANYARFRATYELILDAAVSFVVALHLTLLAILLGAEHWPGRVIPVLVGVVLVVIGNVMPRVRPNLVVGVRTPWTLASGRVWSRTQRIVGTALVLLGAAIMLAALVAPAAVAPLVVYGAFAVVLGGGVLSFALWRSRRGGLVPGGPGMHHGSDSLGS